MPRGMDSVDDRTAKVWSSLGKHVDSIGDCLLLFDGQRRPPVDELVGDLNLPHVTGMSPDSS